MEMRTEKGLERAGGPISGALAMNQASLTHFFPSALPPCTPFFLFFWNPSLPSPCRLLSSLAGAGAADLQFNWSQVLR